MRGHRLPRVTNSHPPLLSKAARGSARPSRAWRACLRVLQSGRVPSRWGSSRRPGLGMPAITKREAERDDRERPAVDSAAISVPLLNQALIHLVGDVRREIACVRGGPSDAVEGDDCSHRGRSRGLFQAQSLSTTPSRGWDVAGRRRARQPGMAGLPLGHQLSHPIADCDRVRADERHPPDM
jgi:hypothetical protein